MQINGRVTDSSTGENIKRAKIALFNGDAELAVLYTDEEGNFEHKESDDFTGDILICKVEKDKYKPQEVKQQIEDEDIDLNIKLIPVRQYSPSQPKRDWMKIGAIALAGLLVASNIYLLVVTNLLEDSVEVTDKNILLGVLKDEDGDDLRICTGSTPSEATYWQQVGGDSTSIRDGIYVDINTSDCGFTSIPNYIVNLNGISGHWRTTGGSEPFEVGQNSFRMYVRWEDDAELTPKIANKHGWNIVWVAIGK